MQYTCVPSKWNLLFFPVRFIRDCRPFVMVLKTERNIYTLTLILHEKSPRGYNLQNMTFIFDGKWGHFYVSITDYYLAFNNVVSCTLHYQEVFNTHFSIILLMWSSAEFPPTLLNVNFCIQNQSKIIVLLVGLIYSWVTVQTFINWAGWYNNHGMPAITWALLIMQVRQHSLLYNYVLCIVVVKIIKTRKCT